MKPTVYVETTIVSYLTAKPTRDVVGLGHQMITREWWSKSRERFDLYASDFVIEEAAQGDPSAAADRLRILADIPLLAITSGTMELAEQLAIALTLPPRARRCSACGDCRRLWNYIPASMELHAFGQRHSRG